MSMVFGNYCECFGDKFIKFEVQLIAVQIHRKYYGIFAQVVRLSSEISNLKLT